jgi:glycosyltransferase involved in cell wall biosynthesis
MEEMISIIVPVYNVGKYISRCIDSILLQTYKNFELILINDGSKDNSLSICREYENKDKRITVIDQKNAGVSAARNAGLDIVFVDSDDYIHSLYLEYLLELCKSNHTKVSQIQYSYVYDEPEENLWKRKIAENFSSTDSNQIWEFQDLFTSSKRKYRAIVWGKLFSKDLFDDYRFRIGRIYEDEEAAFMLLYKAGRIVISGRHMYYYFMKPNSIMRNNSNIVNWDFLYLHENIIRFLEKRQETILLNSERKELCIRLMMKYFSANKNHYIQEDIVRLRKEFEEQYRFVVKNDFITQKEWIALKLFHIFPNLTTFAENKTDIITRAKRHRVQNSK